MSLAKFIAKMQMELGAGSKLRGIESEVAALKGLPNPIEANGPIFSTSAGTKTARALRDEVGQVGHQKMKLARARGDGEAAGDWANELSEYEKRKHFLKSLGHTDG